MTSRRPNFFIIGAPKCGTTSLARYLAENPAVFLTDPKEPGYFSRHLLECDAADIRAERPWMIDVEAYASLYETATAGHRAVGEASTTYLFSERAIGELRKFAPAAKLLVMLRDPLELARSLHAQKLMEGEENLARFEDAWRAQAERRAGQLLSHRPRRPRLLQYGEVASVGKQLERVFALFPRERVKVLLLEDFVREPGQVYREVLEFLGVPDDGREAFPVHNPGRQVTSPWLWRVATWRAGRLLAPYRELRRRLGWNWGGALRQRMLEASTKTSQRESLEPAFAQELREYFSADLRLVQSLTGLRIVPWLDERDARGKE